MSLFGTGLGLLTPRLETSGLNPIPPDGPLSTTSLLRAGSGCEILYLGSAPGLSTSVIQANVRLLSGTSQPPAGSAVWPHAIGIDVSSSIRSLFPFPAGVVYVK